jgi:hypothetical protein
MPNCSNEELLNLVLTDNDWRRIRRDILFCYCTVVRRLKRRLNVLAIHTVTCSVVLSCWLSCLTCALSAVPTDSCCACWLCWLPYTSAIVTEVVIWSYRYIVLLYCITSIAINLFNYQTLRCIILIIGNEIRPYTTWSMNKPL